MESERDNFDETLAAWPIQKGAWTDFVMHSRWSSQDDGVLEVWCNGVKLVDLHDWHTLHVDTERLQPTPTIYVKFGYYGTDVNRVLFHDELRVAKGPGDLRGLVSPPVP